MSNKLDMTAMYAVHNALRRDLELLARTAAKADEHPGRILRTAVGWELFKKALHVHHTAEDDALWPVMRTAAADHRDQLDLLAAMEAEHAIVDEFIGAIDVALADPESGPKSLSGLTDALTVALTAHLKHEEGEALPLIQAIVAEPDWQHFGQVHASLIGPDTPRILPWLLDGASDETIARMLAPLPEPARTAYQNDWQPAYAALVLWSPDTAG